MSNTQIQEGGAAAASNLSIGDRILEVGFVDLRTATHETAVNALLSSGMSIRLLVRHDPPPRELEVRHVVALLDQDISHAVCLLW